MKCNVCQSIFSDELLYESASDRSLTSLCESYGGITRVHACTACGHLQTDEIENVDDYYDHDYTILVESEEEDQIYEIRGEETIYRTDHQVTTFLSKIDLPPQAKLLDYGCAKSSTIKNLLNKRSDIEAFLFDVSERYIPFWEKFIPAGNWATYSPKSEWKENFDVVTSFFSLEHIVQPKDALHSVVNLLKPGGFFYCIIPNVLTNTADFIVVDHVNHFTEASLGYLLIDSGLEVVEIDDSAHRGAFVVIARKPDASARTTNSYTPSIAPADTVRRLEDIAVFWHDAETNARAFETSLGGDKTLAIYGAGFYGAFIASCLEKPENVVCFLDQNPFLQGRDLNGKKIIPPSGLPSNVDTLMIGLNPAYARQIIASIEVLQQRELNCFFL